MADEGFECVICRDECLAPVTTPCGHNYCHACLVGWMERRAECPLCRTAIRVAPEHLQVNRDMERALREVQSLRRQVAAQPANASSVNVLDAGDIVEGDVIGSGRFATVHRGTWQGVPVSLKSVLPAEEGASSVRERFLREAVQLAALRHPNIASLYGMTTRPDGTILLVTQLGRHSLWHAMRSAGIVSPLAVGDILRIGIGVARALAYLHARSTPIAHSDVTSFNVVLDDHGEPMLSDVGVSRELASVAPATGGGTRDAAAWRAPENFDDGHELNGKPPSDVYSLGVLLNEMLAGKCPFEGRDADDIQNAVLHLQQRPSMLGRERAPPALTDLITSAWTQSALERPSAAEILQRLIAVRTELAAEAPPPSTVTVALSPAPLPAVPRTEVRMGTASRGIAELLRFDPIIPEAVELGSHSAASARTNVDNRSRGSAPSQRQEIADAIARLASFPGDEHRCQMACLMLSGMARNYDNCIVIAQLGGIPPVVSVLVRHGNAVVAELACDILANLAMNTDNQAAIARAGGISAMIAALSRYYRDHYVASSASAALGKVAERNADNAVAVVRAGGFPPLVAALALHADFHPDVIESVCYTLVVLTNNSDTAEAYSRAGGIPPLVAALSCHAGDADIVTHACKALSNLTAHIDNQHDIALAGGIPLLLAVLRRHAESSSVIQEACETLCGVGEGNMDNKVAIVHGGGIELLVAALSRHTDSSGVVESVSYALGVLTTNCNANALLIANAGGIAPLIAALRRHVGNARVADTCRWILGNLARHEQVRALLEDA